MSQKICSGCKVSKPLSEFHRRAGQLDGLDYYCKECKRANAEKYLAKPGKIEAAKARAKKWRDENPEKARATHDSWIARNRERYRAANKFRQLRHRYGLEPEEYEALMRESGGKCQLCGSDKRLCVDHCHKSNVVRGILCLRCNTAIERHEVVPDFPRKAAEYLEKHDEQA